MKMATVVLVLGVLAYLAYTNTQEQKRIDAYRKEQEEKRKNMI